MIYEKTLNPFVSEDTPEEGEVGGTEEPAGEPAGEPEEAGEEM